MCPLPTTATNPGSRQRKTRKKSEQAVSYLSDRLVQSSGLLLLQRCLRLLRRLRLLRGLRRGACRYLTRRLAGSFSGR